MLHILTDKEKEAWKDPRPLPQAIHAYNSTCHEPTGYSPHLLLFGCHPRLSVDLWFGLVESTDLVTRVANKNSLSSSAKGKRYYDQKVRGVVLKPGDIVLVKNFGERGGPGKLRFIGRIRYMLSEDRLQIIRSIQKVMAREGLEPCTDACFCWSTTCQCSFHNSQSNLHHSEQKDMCMLETDFRTVENMQKPWGL